VRERAGVEGRHEVERGVGENGQGHVKRGV